MKNDVLKLKTPMMHSPAVRRLQELGDMLGFDYGPNDGIFGEQTESVVKSIQEKYGLIVDGVCGPATWGEVLRRINQEYEPGGSAIADIRWLHENPRLYQRMRSWDKIDGVVLHQTGCEMPMNPSGWGRVNAHIGITQEGTVILINDPTLFIWHAQGLSKSTIGVEIEGNYPGLIDDPKTLWRGGGGPHGLNPPMMKAIEAVRHWIVSEFASHDAVWWKIYAHRQSKNTRMADPGEEIWKAVALEWQQMHLLNDGGPDFCKGTGRPIPWEWDHRSATSYFCDAGGQNTEAREK